MQQTFEKFRLLRAEEEELDAVFASHETCCKVFVRASVTLGVSTVAALWQAKRALSEARPPQTHHKQT